MSNPELYAHVLKKDLWADIDVLGLFRCLSNPEGNRMLALLHSSIAAKTLTPVATQQVVNNPYQFHYCFKPRDIIEWAKAKQIPMPDELREWYDKQTNPREPEAHCKDWEQTAREIGQKIHETNAQLSIEKIAAKVYQEMTARKNKGESGMTGRGNKVPSAETIKRHALKGIKG